MDKWRLPGPSGGLQALGPHLISLVCPAGAGGDSGDTPYCSHDLKFHTASKLHLGNLQPFEGDAPS